MYAKWLVNKVNELVLLHLNLSNWQLPLKIATCSFLCSIMHSSNAMANQNKPMRSPAQTETYVWKLDTAAFFAKYESEFTKATTFEQKIATIEKMKLELKKRTSKNQQNVSMEFYYLDEMFLLIPHTGFNKNHCSLYKKDIRAAFDPHEYGLPPVIARAMKFLDSLCL